MPGQRCGAGRASVTTLFSLGSLARLRRADGGFHGEVILLPM